MIGKNSQFSWKLCNTIGSESRKAPQITITFSVTRTSINYVLLYEWECQFTSTIQLTIRWNFWKKVSLTFVSRCLSHLLICDLLTFRAWLYSDLCNSQGSEWCWPSTHIINICSMNKRRLNAEAYAHLFYLCFSLTLKKLSSSHSNLLFASCCCT